MNSYNFTLAGSGILLILSILIAFAFTIYSYKNTIPPISLARKRVLIFLRGTALSILIFILFQPIIEILRFTEIKPKIAVLIDNSISVGIKNNKINNKKYTDQAISKLNEKIDESYILYEFGNETLKLEKDSLLSIDFSREKTNISLALEKLSELKQRENIKSVILLSDGNVNSGDNPIYSEYLSEFPINSVILADTNEYKDNVLNSILTNQIAYQNTTIPVEVVINTKGFEKDSLEVRLLNQNQIVESQVFYIFPEKSTYKLMFQFLASKVGTQKITAKIVSKTGEVDLNNNLKSAYIKVLDNKKKIALFAGSPSYDVATISRFLSNDNSVNLKKYIQKKGAGFYKEPTQTNLDESQLFVFIGFPNKFTNKALLDRIAKQIDQGAPYLMIFSKDIDNLALTKFARFLPFKVASAGSKEFSALPYIEKTELSNSIINLTGKDSDLDLWNSLPPLYKTETFLNVKQGGNALVKVLLNGTKFYEPLVITREINNQKSMVIAGYGLHRWRLEGFARDITKGQESFNLLDKFLENSLKWLSVKDIKNKFEIHTDKKQYLNGESVFISANLLDEKLSPLDNAEINVKIQSNQEERELILSSIGNGRYTGAVDGLVSGDYVLKSSAIYKDKLLANDNTKFSVGELSLEYQNLNANLEMLNKISTNSGGKSYAASQVEEAINDIKSDTNFNSNQVQELTINELWQKPWLLGISILLFGFEWFLRKRAGML